MNKPDVVADAPSACGALDGPVRLDARIRARLELVRKDMTDHFNEVDDCVSPLFNDAGELGAAVLAVIDLHKPTYSGGAHWCDSCIDAYGGQWEYPCATARGVAEALGIPLNLPPSSVDEGNPDR